MGAAKALLKKAGQRAIAKKVAKEQFLQRVKRGLQLNFLIQQTLRTLKKGDTTDILEELKYTDFLREPLGVSYQVHLSLVKCTQILWGKVV